MCVYVCDYLLLMQSGKVRLVLLHANLKALHISQKLKVSHFRMCLPDTDLLEIITQFGIFYLRAEGTGELLFQRNYYQGFLSKIRARLKKKN